MPRLLVHLLLALCLLANGIATAKAGAHVDAFGDHALVQAEAAAAPAMSDCGHPLPADTDAPPAAQDDNEACHQLCAALAHAGATHLPATLSTALPRAPASAPAQPAPAPLRLTATPPPTRPPIA